MASVGSALITKILGHSAVEKAFIPWWDSIKDFLVYSLVMLGILVSPTAIITGTPLYCTLCSTESGCPKNESLFKPRNEDGNYKVSTYTNASQDPKFYALWVKEYCTKEALDRFILYFPYILLIIAVVIVMVERLFIKISKTGLGLDIFYDLIEREILNEPEDTEDDEEMALNQINDADNRKKALEVVHTFENSRSYFLAYVSRVVINAILAISLLAILIAKGVPSMRRGDKLYCNVHGYGYECAGHPREFYTYVLCAVFLINSLFIMACAFNLLWVFFPYLGVLCRVMTSFRKTVKNMKSSRAKRELEDLCKVYYRNRDLKLLLDLLAESSGIATSIRLMSLLDTEFHDRCKPTELSITQEGSVASVEFSDAKIMTDIFADALQIVCIYTVEILPNTNSSSIVAFKFSKSRNEEGEMSELDGRGMASCVKRKTEFRHLEDNVPYTIRVCTIINGRTIASSDPQSELKLREQNRKKL